MKDDRTLQKLELENARLRDELRQKQQDCRMWLEESRRSEEQLLLAQAIVENSPVILFRRSADLPPELQYVSENISNFGYKAKEFLTGAMEFADIVHPEDQKRMNGEIELHTQENKDVYLQEYRILTRQGDIRWVLDRTVIVRDAEGRRLYHQGILHDITRRKMAEEDLRRSEERHRRVLETAAEGFMLMDLDMTILKANESLLTMLGYSRTELEGKRAYDLASPAFQQYLDINAARLRAEERRRFEGELLTRDGRIVPVMIHGNILRNSEGAPIGHVAFLADLTSQKKALLLAEEVQKSLLPDHAPEIPGLDIAGRSLSSAEVGGDYYDFVPSEDGLNVAVGDISGHGVDAALLMTSARAFMRMRATSPGAPAHIVSEMNRHLSQDLDGTGRFMTLFLIRFAPETGQVRWVRAGHDPALVYCPGTDSFTEMNGSGLPLGVDTETAFEEHLSTIHPGQLVAVGTDGIWEARNSRGEMFGKNRFRDILRHHADKSSAAIIDAVFDAVIDFTASVRPEDDVTLVVIKCAAA